ncbi:MAG: aminotransferase class I/II-fold pyridoxal phosphate-dependent enzyme [Clostridia bacterium]|nr:aminotransferase class I/II-fold pyridoxal phosphate-dependent enzyme [Clostridia bacterium]
MEIKPFNNKIWLSTPTMHEEEKLFVDEAFDTNWVSTLGENINQLEQAICNKVGCRYSLALSSGTTSLHLAIKLAGVKPGDKVFCTDMTFIATVNPVVYEAAEPIFIDSEADTWNMDPKALERAFEIYGDAKAVVVTNLYGVPAKLDEIKAICKKHNAVLIEDAAESLGATFEGVQTGTYGDYGVISFNGNKIITCSSGGMLLSNDKNAIDLARKLSTQAKEDAPWYQHEFAGYNYRLSNVLAGIGRGQLLHLDEHVKAKKAIYERYKEGLENLPVKMNPFDEKKMEPNFWLSCILIDKEAMCKQIRQEKEFTYISEKGKSCPEEIREKLASFNVESRPIWKPMHMQPVFKNCGFVKANDTLCVDEDIFDRGLCLPSDIKMTEQEQDIVIEIIKSCF